MARDFLIRIAGMEKPSYVAPKLLGAAIRSGTTFTYIWRYANEPLLGKITANGRTKWTAFNVYHS